MSPAKSDPNKINNLYDWIGVRPSLWPANATGQGNAVEYFMKHYEAILRVATNSGKFTKNDLDAITLAFEPSEHEAHANMYAAKWGRRNLYEV